MKKENNTLNPIIECNSVPVCPHCGEPSKQALPINQPSNGSNQVRILYFQLKYRIIGKKLELLDLYTSTLHIVNEQPGKQTRYSEANNIN